MSRGVKDLQKILATVRLSSDHTDDVGDGPRLVTSSRNSCFTSRFDKTVRSDQQPVNDKAIRRRSGDSSSDPVCDSLSESESVRTDSRRSSSSEQGCTTARITTSAFSNGGRGNGIHTRAVVDTNSCVAQSETNLGSCTDVAQSGRSVNDAGKRARSFSEIFTYVDCAVVADWLAVSKAHMDDLSVWCRSGDNFINFAHFWLSEISQRERLNLLRLEHDILRENLRFAFSAGLETGDVKIADITAVLSAVFHENPAQLVGPSGGHLFLDYLDLLSVGRGERFRQLLADVRSGSRTEVREHRQWLLAARSFCVISLWTAGVSFYRRLRGESSTAADLRCGSSSESTATIDSYCTGKTFDDLCKERLFSTIRHGFVDVLHYLIQSRKVSPSVIDAQHRSVVFLAVVEKQDRILKYLIDRVPDVDVNLPSSSGNTPLHAAASAGSVELVRILTKFKGTEIDARNTDCDGATPLHVAITQGHADVVRLLLKRGADPALRLSDGRDALDVSLSSSPSSTSILHHSDIIEQLRAASESLEAAR